jgi:NADH-quinone oxidoreductase subunit N
MDLSSFAEVNVHQLAWIRPELALAAGVIALLVLDLLVRRNTARVAILTVAALIVFAAAGAFLALQPGGPLAIGVKAQPIFSKMLAYDAYAAFFKWLFLVAGAVTVILVALGSEVARARVGEFNALLVAIVLGMFLMASAANLLMMYLAIELVSMTSYVLAGFRRGDRRASEAALKYVIYGGVASGVMLFGMSWLYGLAGTFSVFELNTLIGHGLQISGAAVVGGRLAFVAAIVFVAVGIGYKVAAVPFHMWCPDVYEGAPTPFTAFLSVGPKAAGFALAWRFFFALFFWRGGGTHLSQTFAALGIESVPWTTVMGIVAAVTMTLGNLAALAQTNLKRLLAYSSIAHAGYTLMGLAAGSGAGMQSVLIYMAVYLVMNLGAFAVVMRVAAATGSESILDYRGLVRRQPLTAIAFVVFLLSLTGLPPFAGFIGKYYLFTAVWREMQDHGGGWYAVLLVIAALNTAVSLFYYARIIRAMFLDPAAVPEPAPLRRALGFDFVAGALAVAVIVIGVLPGGLINATIEVLRNIGGGYHIGGGR